MTPNSLGRKRENKKWPLLTMKKGNKNDSLKRELNSYSSGSSIISFLPPTLLSKKERLLKLFQILILNGYFFNKL